MVKQKCNSVTRKKKWVVVLDRMWCVLVHFLIDNLDKSHWIIRYGTWAFIPEIATKTGNSLFGGQEVVFMDVIGDVIILMVCQKNSNPIDNVFSNEHAFIMSFHDHETNYATTNRDTRRRTTKKMSRLVHCNLPKDCALVFIWLCSINPAIIEEEFKIFKF